MAQADDPARDASTKYCRRFGQLAVEMGFIGKSQLDAAFERQRQDLMAGRPHRLVGAILFQEGAMSSEQIEQVLKAIFREGGA